MTELEIAQFLALLEELEKDLAHLRTYDRDFKRVRTAAESALDGREYQWKEIAQRIHYLCIKISQDLDDQEDLMYE